MMYFVWWYSVGLFSTGSDDVIVACVREVIDQLNQVSMSSKEKWWYKFNSHTARTALLNSFLFWGKILFVNLEGLLPSTWHRNWVWDFSGTISASVEIIDCIPGTVVLTCLTKLHEAFFAPCKLYCCFWPVTLLSVNIFCSDLRVCLLSGFKSWCQKGMVVYLLYSYLL